MYCNPQRWPKQPSHTRSCGFWGETVQNPSSIQSLKLRLSFILHLFLAPGGCVQPPLNPERMVPGRSVCLIIIWLYFQEMCSMTCRKLAVWGKWKKSLLFTEVSSPVSHHTGSDVIFFNLILLPFPLEGPPFSQTQTASVLWTVTNGSDGSE